MSRRRRGRTLRVRLIVVVSSLLLGALALLGVASAAVLRQSLIGEAETTLYLAHESTTAKVLDAIESAEPLPDIDDYSLAVPPDGFHLIVEQSRPAVSAFLTRDFTYRRLTPTEIEDVLAGTRASGDTGTITVEGSGTYLVTSSVLRSGDGDAITVVSGVGLADTDALVGTYALWLTLGGAGLAAVAVGLGYRLVERELEPLERVAEVAQAVVATPLSSGEVAPQGRVPRDARHAGSETDRVAEALNQLLAHVEQSLNARHRVEESMRRFVAEASHELRNPLASIRGYADFYSRSATDPEEMTTALGRINAEATRMSGLVDDLLLLAKLDADPRVRRDEVELSRIVLETVADARFAHPDHSWRIELPDEAVLVVGDEDAIRQMVLNLTSNAGHHTPAGTVVRITIDIAPMTTSIVVEDDGPGIPAEALPTLFDRFTQGRTSSQTRQATTVGLGLAIVHALAAASGYAVRAGAGADGRGARFTIEIPRAEDPAD